MIIIEGPDGAGKTTLVNRLLSTFGGEVTLGQRTKPRDRLYQTALPDVCYAFTQFVLDDRVTLWDRLFYSELIYAPLVRHQPPSISIRQASFFHAMLQTIETPVVICCPPFEEVKQNVENTDQMEGVLPNLNAVWRAYRSLCDVGHPFVHHDYTKTFAEARVLGLVEKYILTKRESNR